MRLTWGSRDRQEVAEDDAGGDSQGQYDALLRKDAAAHGETTGDQEDGAQESEGSRTHRDRLHKGPLVTDEIQVHAFHV